MHGCWGLAGLNGIRIPYEKAGENGLHRMCWGTQEYEPYIVKGESTGATRIKEIRKKERKLCTVLRTCSAFHAPSVGQNGEQSRQVPKYDAVQASCSQDLCFISSAKNGGEKRIHASFLSSSAAGLSGGDAALVHAARTNCNPFANVASCCTVDIFNSCSADATCVRGTYKAKKWTE